MSWRAQARLAYHSEKSVDADTGEWRHTKIVLEPLNPTFPPIELKVATEDEFRVVAEFVEVLRLSALETPVKRDER